MPRLIVEQGKLADEEDQHAKDGMRVQPSFGEPICVCHTFQEYREQCQVA